MVNNKRIIISMTSWTKRIGNVSKVIISLLNQTVKADSIELNLSLEEFTNKEKDLPEDLLLLINDNKVIINWVEHNTGVFKKAIPVLRKYFGEDYYLLTVDDDCLYNSNYIETMIKQLDDYDYYCLLDNKLVIGYCMIFRSTCFETDYFNLITDKLITIGINDYFIDQYLIKKHKKHSLNNSFEKETFITMYNEIYPNSITGKYDIKRINDCIYETQRILKDVK